MNIAETEPKSFYYNTFPPNRELDEIPLNFLLHKG